MAQTETVFILLQLVALALPAIAIYLQVLTSVFSKPEQTGEIYGGARAPVLQTYAHKRPEFLYGRFSLLLLILSTPFLLVQVGLEANGLVGALLISLPLILIILAFILFGISVFQTPSN